jgi:hypothetical protein
MARRRSFFAAVVVGWTSLSFGGACSVLSTLVPPTAALTPPTIALEGAILAQAPSQQRLAAYYCPDVAASSLGATASRLLCQGFFGPRPTPVEMQVAFDLRFRIHNPNQVPLPMSQVLAAVTVFPKGQSQRLGAACVQLCADGDPSCTGAPAAGACQDSTRDVRSLSDFEGAAANFLIGAGIAVAGGQPISFKAPTIIAASDLDVVVRFSFGPQELLASLRQLAAQSASELRGGHQVSFAIPYRIEGTAWFDAGSVGRIAVGYGPLDGSWVLPVEGLGPL